MTQIFRVYSAGHNQIGPDFSDLASARRVHTFQASPEPAFVQEVWAPPGRSSQSIYHSYWPRPETIEARPHTDLEQSLAWSISLDEIASAVRGLDLGELIDQQNSQPQEDVLEDQCRSIADRVVTGEDRARWYSHLPADPVRREEVERALVDDLCGMAQDHLVRRLRDLARTAYTMARDLEAGD